MPTTLQSRTLLIQGRIQSKFEGGAVGSEGAEKFFQKTDDECTLYSLCKEIFTIIVYTLRKSLY